MKKQLLTLIISGLSVFCLGQSKVDTTIRFGICEQDLFNNNTTAAKFKSSFSDSDTILSLIKSKSGHFVKSYISYEESYFAKPNIISWNDSTIELSNCDSLSAIKILLKEIEFCHQRESDLWSLVGTAVTFTNSVPDYFKLKKNNKTWTPFWAQLKKFGYKIGMK